MPSIRTFVFWAFCLGSTAAAHEMQIRQISALEFPDAFPGHSSLQHSTPAQYEVRVPEPHWGRRRGHRWGGRYLNTHVIYSVRIVTPLRLANQNVEVRLTSTSGVLHMRDNGTGILSIGGMIPSIPPNAERGRQTMYFEVTFLSIHGRETIRTMGDVTVISPVSIGKIYDVDFGEVLQGRYKDIKPNESDMGRGKLWIQGELGYPYKLQIPQSVELTGPRGDKITASLVVSGAPEQGRFEKKNREFLVGGRVTVPPKATAGHYRGTATITVLYAN